MFRLPSDKSRRQQWLVSLSLTKGDVKEQTRVCRRHFLHGDSSNIPLLDLGKSFASPKKTNTDRNKRAAKRSLRSFACPPKRISTTPSSRASSVSDQTPCTTGDEEMSVSACESFFSNSSPNELSFRSDCTDSSTALAARIELLEAETKFWGSSV